MGVGEYLHEGKVCNMQYVNKPFTLKKFNDDVVKPSGKSKIASEAWKHYLDTRMDVRILMWVISEASK